MFVQNVFSREESKPEDAVIRHDPFREKSNLENPQIFQICKYLK